MATLEAELAIGFFDEFVKLIMRLTSISLSMDPSCAGTNIINGTAVDTITEHMQCCISSE